MRLPVRTAKLAVLAAAVSLAASIAVAPASAAGRCGSHAWCDMSLSPDARAALVVASLTATEKLDLLWGDEQVESLNRPGSSHTGTNAGVPRLDIPPLYMTDGPVGVRQGAAATAMPAPLSLAAAFDPASAQRAGALVAEEAKARGNDLLFAPTVNIMRTPQGGRTFEGYGEDPFLSGRQAVGWIEGAQSRGVIANVKHFAANNQETGRMTGNSVVDERTLREIYLPQFEAAVKEADSGSVMCSYNKLNGQHACENRHLLTDILKGEWGFKGFVLADYPAAHDTAASLANGLDFEPSGTAYYPGSTMLALLQGRATQAQVDDHVARILRTMFAFGTFDRASFADDRSRIPAAAHAKVAQTIEEGGITLLKNARRVLPIRPATVKTLALIGSDAATFTKGGGSSNVTPLVTVTPKQGIEARATAVGVRVRYEGSDDPQAAAAAAKGADVAVVVVADAASEGYDRACVSITCPTPGAPVRDADALVAAVAAVNPRTVVVMETGGPVLTPWRDAVAGIVEAWYPGESGGAAIARVLFGDVDPGGRLPVTFPLREEDLPTAGDPGAFPGVNGTVTYKEGVFVGYRWFDERRLATAFPFGHGLSYTSFALRALRTTVAGDTITVGVTVRNTGRRTGHAIPQLYVGLPDPDAGAGVTQPPYQLKGFQKLSLRPGAARRVRFTLDRRSLSYWDTGRSAWTVAPGCYRLAVGASSRALTLRARLPRAGGRC